MGRRFPRSSICWRRGRNLPLVIERLRHFGQGRAETARGIELDRVSAA
jgi:hypothetical protein